VEEINTVQKNVQIKVKEMELNMCALCVGRHIIEKHLKQTGIIILGIVRPRAIIAIETIKLKSFAKHAGSHFIPILIAANIVLLRVGTRDLQQRLQEIVLSAISHFMQNLIKLYADMEDFVQ